MLVTNAKTAFLIFSLCIAFGARADIVKIIMCHNPTGPRIDYIKDHSNEKLSKWPPDVITDGYKNTHPAFVFEIIDGKYKGTYTWGHSSSVENLAGEAGVVLNDPSAREIVVTEFSEKRIVGIMFAETATALFTFFPEAEKAAFTWHSASFYPKGRIGVSNYFAECDFSNTQ